MDKNFKALPDRNDSVSFRLHPLCIQTIHGKSKINYGVDQRNLGLDFVSEGYVFFLDDDTIMHPNFMSVYKRISPTMKPFTVNQHRYEHEEWILKGDNPVPCKIDTCMMCAPKNIIGDVRWLKETDHHDGVFINSVWNLHKEDFIFVDEVASYFNFLNRR